MVARGVRGRSCDHSKRAAVGGALNLEARFIIGVILPGKIHVAATSNHSSCQICWSSRRHQRHTRRVGIGRVAGGVVRTDPIEICA
jgi:hypothetical protein